MTLPILRINSIKLSYQVKFPILNYETFCQTFYQYVIVFNYLNFEIKNDASFDDNNNI